MATRKDDNSEKKPLGDRIRDLINPALEDERKHKIQLKILDEAFEKLAVAFPKIMKEKFSDIFNEASGMSNPEAKNIFLIKALTEAPNGRPKYSPTLPLNVPIETAFTKFSADDINGLPGYIKLHLAARAANVAIKVVNLTADEARGGSPALIFDGSKTYEQGAMENYRLYPDLPEIAPPPPTSFDRRGPGHYDL